MSKEPKRNVYVGHRYVPLIMDEWDNTKSYEGLSIVTYQGGSYTSKKHVPIGIDITDNEYWSMTGNYNAQIEHYRQEVRDVQENVDILSNDLDVSIGTINDEISKTLKKDLYFIDVKDFGAMGDGVTDDTESINDAITYASENNIEEVRFTSGTYMIKANDGETIVYGNRGGIALKDNITLKLDDNTVLKAIPNEDQGYNIIRGRNVNNVKIIGGTIQGDRNEHQGVDGEWGHGINLRDCNNVYIRTKCIDCWGDGIFLGGGSSPTKNVVIENTISDNNRRQGLSMVYTENVKIYNSHFTNTNGTYPEAGIDMEPSNANESVINTSIINCNFSGNRKTGVLLHGKFGDIKETYINNSTFDSNEIGIRLEEDKTSNVYLTDIIISNSTLRAFNINNNASNIDVVNLKGINNGNDFRVQLGNNIKLRDSTLGSISFLKGCEDIELNNITLIKEETQYMLYVEQVSKFNIINSHFKGNTSLGIRFLESSYVVIEGNIITGIEKYGITANIKDSIIRNNTFLDIGDETSEFIIELTSFSHRNNITNNVARSSKTDKPINGVRLSSTPQNNYITNNDFYSSYSDEVVLDNEQGNNIIENNR